MFLLLFVCVFVSKVSQKVVGEFSLNLGIGRLWTTEELVKFWNWCRTHSRYFVLVIHSTVVNWCEKWK